MADSISLTCLKLRPCTCSSHWNWFPSFNRSLIGAVIWDNTCKLMQVVQHAEKLLYILLAGWVLSSLWYLVPCLDQAWDHLWHITCPINLTSLHWSLNLSLFNLMPLVRQRSNKALSLALWSDSASAWVFLFIYLLLCQCGSEIQNTHLTWTDYHSFNRKSIHVIHLEIAKVNLSN